VPLKPGSRLRSQVCTTEVVVILSPADDIDLRCGGEPMVDIAAEVPAGQNPLGGLDTGTQLGKRYTTDEPDSALELLATKAGRGTLSVGSVPLVLKPAKPIPSSD
jgi:hypothetical protein